MIHVFESQSVLRIIKQSSRFKIRHQVLCQILTTVDIHFIVAQFKCSALLKVGVLKPHISTMWIFSTFVENIATCLGTTLFFPINFPSSRSK